MFVVDSLGLSGGLILLWRKNLRIDIVSPCTRYIEAKIDDNYVRVKWNYLFIYGEPNSNKIVDFFQSIIVKIKSIYDPILAIGDWNCLWYRKDNVGGSRITPRNLTRATNILEEGYLLDLGHYGP